MTSRENTVKEFFYLLTSSFRLQLRKRAVLVETSHSYSSSLAQAPSFLSNFSPQNGALTLSKNISGSLIFAGVPVGSRAATGLSALF
jgi:hypothetical protein